MSSIEQECRDILERMEVEGAQNYSAGELCEMANLISELHGLRKRMTRPGTREAIERCLIHWLPELAPSQRRAIAISIVGALITERGL